VKRFAFIIHPLVPKDISRFYPVAKYLPDPVIEWFTARKSPIEISHITGIRSATGAETEGWFIGCPLTPDQMINQLPLEAVYDKLGECAKVAEGLGADLIGLGAFTSVVGDGGISVRKRSKIGVTTGNSYTVATAIQGLLRACEELEIDPSRSTLAVVGATGSIGKTCAQVLSRQFERTIVVGRDLARTAELAESIPRGTATVDVARIREADAIITVTSTDAAIIMPEHLKPGAVICDVARPRDVSVRVAKERNDILVIEGGVVAIPGDVDFRFNFGFPAKTAYACMSETILLALEGNPELYDFTLGKDVSVAQVDQITALADKHGFGLAGFRSFEKAVNKDQITRAKAARLTAMTVPRGA
jgi:predicted amino acid dehydrogenase